MILQVSKYYAPTVGGIEQVARTIATGLSDRNHEVEVLAASKSSDPPKEIDGVPIQRSCAITELSSVPIAPTFPFDLRRGARTADLLHYHLPNPLAVVSHAFAPDRPTVATYHSDIVGRRLAMAGYTPVLRRFLDTADRIVTTSPRLLEHSEYLRPVVEKCRVIPPSINPNRYGAYDGPDLGIVDPDRSTVLFAGRLSYYKGVEYLINASRHVDAEFLIAGDGERRKELERQAAECDVNDRVRFLGYVPDRTLRYLYDRADVFVLPSVESSEAFGIVQLEAMAAKTPVVNTDLETGVPWVSPDGETGLTVPPRDTTALADAIESLLADPQRRAEMGERGRKRVEAMFATEGVLSRYEQLYGELLTD